MRGLSGTKGRSFVVSTVILVVISLVTTAASLTYLTGVQEVQTNVEQIVIRSVNVNPVPNLGQQTNQLIEGGGWIIAITLTNKGNREATITNIFLNGKPLETYNNVAVFDGMQYVQSGAFTLLAPSGRDYRLSFAIKQGADTAGGIVFSPGLYLELKCQSASGAYCMQLVTLK